MSYPGPSSSHQSQRWWTAVQKRLLPVVYPFRCRACEVFLPSESAATSAGLERWLCQKCIRELDRIEAPYCAACGEGFSGAMDRAFLCPNCTGRRLAFEFAISGFKANGHLREVLHRFKYSRDLSLRGLLADALLAALDDPRLAAEDLSQWILVPVPLHWLRQVQRSFNQSWELCQELSSRTGIPAGQVLWRRRRSATQARLNRQERLENLRGVFSLPPRWRFWRRSADVRGKKVLLVDDVLTTGATTHECARVLRREGGAEKVVVITAARG
ncbi:MAG: ComF family protein [Verrucomicrobiota bacterium]